VVQTLKKSRPFKRFLMMQEILTVATYLVAWLVCDYVIGIQSGLIKLLISLGAAVSVYVFIGIKEYTDKKKEKMKSK